MDGTDSSPDAKSNPHLQAVAELFRIEQALQQTKAAQRSAAESFEKSADSHDRAAKSYEKLAELGEGDEYLERAARHRGFAQEDRQIAERLRRMAGD
jgi:hypothetical protein